MLSLIFDAVGVAVFIVYHFVLSAGQALKTISYFFTQKQIQVPPKIVSLHPTDVQMLHGILINDRCVRSSVCDMPT